MKFLSYFLSFFVIGLAILSAASPVHAGPCAQVEAYVMDLATGQGVSGAQALLRCNDDGNSLCTTAGSRNGPCFENSNWQSVPADGHVTFGSNDNGYDCFQGPAKLETQIPAGWTWVCSTDGSKNDCSGGTNVDTNSLSTNNGGQYVFKVFYNPPPPPPQTGQPTPTPPSTVNVSGWLYYSGGGAVANKALLDSGCNIPAATTTDSNGFFNFNLAYGTSFCIRGPDITDYTKSAINARVTGSGYEFQVAGKNCAGNSSCSSDEQAHDRSQNTDYTIKYTSTLTPINLAASCSSPGPTANLSWSSSSASVTSYNLRVNNLANVWNNDCTFPLTGDFCFNPTSLSQLFTGINGASYSWWIHGCKADGTCSEARGGPDFSCPITSISVSPTSITKTTTWPQLTLAINTNDVTASRVMVCEVNPPGQTINCNSDTAGWTNISSFLTPSTLNKDGSSHNYTFNPPSDYRSGIYYFAVFPSGTPRLAGSNSVTFIQPLPFDFTVSNPGDVSLVKGSTDAGRTTTVTRVGGAPESVTLSLVGSIGGATASFNPASCTPSAPGYTCSSTLTFNTSSATVGTYAGLKVRGTATGGAVRDSSTFTLTITATAQPNLTVDTLDSISVQVNNSVSPQATVRNNGTASTGVTSTTRLRIDTNKNGDYTDAGDISSDKTTGILSAGGTASHTWSSAWTPSSTGTYNYQICADDKGVVTESDETIVDNCESSTISVTSTPPPTPTTGPTPTTSGAPWIQTSGGDVHSNTRINTPGGPP